MARQHVCAALVGSLVLSLLTLPVLRAGEADVKASTPKLSSEEAIKQALDSKTEFEFLETPLPEVVDFIKQLHHINLQIDERRLSEAGVLPDVPVTLTVKEITLRSALKLMLDQLGLAPIVQNEVLLISTPEGASAAMVTKTYDVSDLVRVDGKTEGPAYNGAALIEVVQGTIAAETWSDAGGPASIREFDGLLAVTNVAAVQERVVGLLRAIREVRSADYSKGGVQIWTNPAGDKPGRISAALQQRVTVDFNDTPLRDALTFIQHKYDLPVIVDSRSLASAGTAEDAPISVKVDDIRLENALQHMLKASDLTYLVRDEVLFVTTLDAAEANLSLAVYGVRDLIDNAVRTSGSDAQDASDALMELIAGTIVSSSWDSVGGASSIRSLPEFGEFVVSQTSEGHRELNSLLTQLRKSLADRKQNGKEEAARREQIKLVVYTIQPTPVAAAGEPKNPLQPTAAEWEKLVPEFVAPDSWKSPQVTVRAAGDRLFVRQTLAVHRQIAEFLGHPMSSGSGMGGGGGFFAVPSDGLSR